LWHRLSGDVKRAEIAVIPSNEFVAFVISRQNARIGIDMQAMSHAGSLRLPWKGDCGRNSGVAGCGNIVLASLLGIRYFMEV
jgi:hypothetical protein